MHYVLYAQYDIEPANSGLLVGEECPAFKPEHTFGHDTEAKPALCVSMEWAGVMVWGKHGQLIASSRLVQFLEQKISEGAANMRQ
jgi:protocatechuate 3,4-dioxygenase beta subunit